MGKFIQIPTWLQSGEFDMVPEKLKYRFCFLYILKNGLDKLVMDEGKRELIKSTFHLTDGNLDKMLETYKKCGMLYEGAGRDENGEQRVVYILPKIGRMLAVIQSELFENRFKTLNEAEKYRYSILLAHTDDCGMVNFTDKCIQEIIKEMRVSTTVLKNLMVRLCDFGLVERVGKKQFQVKTCEELKG